VSQVYAEYTSYCIAQEIKPLDYGSFGQHIKYLLSAIVTTTKVQDKKTIRVYCNIQQMKNFSTELYTMASGVAKYFQNHHRFQILQMSSDKVHTRLQTTHIVNAIPLFIDVIIYEKTSSMEVLVGNKVVELAQLGFEEKFFWSTEHLTAFAKCMQKLRFCTGRSVSAGSDIRLTPSVLIENWDGDKRAKSMNCDRIVSFLSISNCCDTCRYVLKYAAKPKRPANLVSTVM
jgi:hypothetical protein